MAIEKHLGLGLISESIYASQGKAGAGSLKIGSRE
jgi:hypothetical protein